MSDTKIKKIVEVMKTIPVDWEPPKLDPELSILEMGLLCILSRTLTESQAEKSLRSLKGSYADWNELRVSQIQEFRGQLQTKSIALQDETARNVKTFLQEIFQENHGFDLEFLREDLGEGAKFISQLEFLGARAGYYLLWCANPESLPVSTGIIRVLDRMGLMKRTSSLKKAQANLEPGIGAGQRQLFAISYGLVVERWCDSKKPTCWECVLVSDCPYGTKVEKDWKVQQTRLEAQRKRDEERRKKDEARERKRAETEARRKARELERLQRVDEKRRQAEAKKRELEEAKKRKDREKVQQKKKRAADEKRAVQAKKKAQKKPVAKKSAKKKTAKRATARKTATKAASGRKKPVKKSTKKSTKKTAPKKPAKKSGARKTGASKVTKKRTPAKGGAAKSSKRKTTKKASRKKSSKRR